MCQHTYFPFFFQNSNPWCCHNRRFHKKSTFFYFFAFHKFFTLCILLNNLYIDFSLYLCNNYVCISVRGPIWKEIFFVLAQSESSVLFSTKSKSCHERDKRWKANFFWCCLHSKRTKKNCVLQKYCSLGQPFGFHLFKFCSTIESLKLSNVAEWATARDSIKNPLWHSGPIFWILLLQ